MELDVLTHSPSVLRNHAQEINKQKEIELYYELLSSGHSVGEILDALGRIQWKSEHGNITAAEPPPPLVGGVAPDVTSEAALTGEVPADTQHIPSLTASVEAESGGTEDLRATECTLLKVGETGDQGAFPGERLPGSESNIIGLATAHTPTGSEVSTPPHNQELRQSSKFSMNAKQFAIGALYTVAVASASIASFAFVNGRPATDLTTTSVQSGIPSRTEAVAARISGADRSERVDEGQKAAKQVANVNNSSAPDSPRSADPHSAVPDSTQRERAEVSITFPESTSHIRGLEELSRQVNPDSPDDLAISRCLEKICLTFQ